MANFDELKSLQSAWNKQKSVDLSDFGFSSPTLPEPGAPLAVEYYHRDPHKVWHKFSKDDSEKIERSFQAGDDKCEMRLPHQPAGANRYEIRFGANAISPKWTTEAHTGFLQVNLGNDNSRLVKREELLEDFGPLPPSPPPSQDSPKADLADLQQQLSVKTKECGRLKAANTELTDANATLLAENATLKADLRAALRNGSSGSINKIGSPRVERRPRASTIGAADAVLHPALEAFVPLSEAAGPASVKNQAGPEGMRALQAAIRANPCDGNSKAATAALRKRIADFVDAMQAEIGQRLSGPRTSGPTVAEALIVTRKCNDAFSEVYLAVWNSLSSAEGFGVQLYENARDNLLELIGQPLIEKGVKVKKPTQRKAATEDAVQLFTDAVLSKPAFDDVMSELEAACAAAGVNAQLIVCDVKACDRMIQKGIFSAASVAAMGGGGRRKGRSNQKHAKGGWNIDVSEVTDAVRAMLVAASMEDVAGILETLTQMMRDGKIVVVLFKGRFIGMPSSGGWRDAFCNIYVPSADKGAGGVAELKHICELQVVHAQLLNAREGLPGHDIYARARNAVELIEVAFGKDFAEQIFEVLHNISIEVGHPDYKGRLTIEMAEEKVTAAAAAATYGSPLCMAWSGEKQAMFLECYLPSVWHECSFEDTIPFIETAQSWDLSRFTENPDTPWFGSKEKSMDRWAGLHSVTPDGRIQELRFDGFVVDGVKPLLTLPDSMDKLSAVTRVVLSGMTRLPPSMAKMPSLKDLDVWGCSLAANQNALIAQIKAAGVTVHGK